MEKTRIELLLHPIRMQIVTTMAAQQMTVQEISSILKIPQTTLYRHVKALVEGGVLTIVEETQKRGTVERQYALAAPPSLSAEELLTMRKADYEKAFVLIVTTLISDMQRYLDTKPEDEPFDVLADGADISKVRIFLSDDEFKTMNTRISRLMLAAIKKKPTQNRKPRIFSYVFIPEK